MPLLLVFAVTLLVAVLVSGLAQKSILSTAVLFLCVGFAVGKDGLGWVPLEPTSDVVSILAVLALFSTLFTDGMHVGLEDLRGAWHLPGRAILLGLPLSLLVTAALAYGLVGLSWTGALLLGAILAPTDPVFAAALVGREEVPKRLRHLLNVESGLNDGLALPVVIFLLATAARQETHPLGTLSEVLTGIVLGIVIPWAAIRLEKSRFFEASTQYEPLNAFAIGLFVFAVCHRFHFNEFLAAFAAGVTLATLAPHMRKAFDQFGGLIAELFKLAAVLVFGSLISFRFLGEVDAWGYVFAFATLFVVRPLTLALALVGSNLDWKQRAAAAWFGPKGFASMVYGILAVKSGIAEADQIFHLAAIVITGSIILHSSTDVLVARSFVQQVVDSEEQQIREEQGQSGDPVLSR